MTQPAFEKVVVALACKAGNGPHILDQIQDYLGNYGLYTLQLGVEPVSDQEAEEIQACVPPELLED